MTPQETSNGRDLARYFPILGWLPRYQRSWLRVDFIAAITVLVLLVPEGMAYAQMAGLPPETAFYTAPAAMVGYAIFTTSRQVITTTTSTIAVMVAAVVGAYAVSGTDEYIAMSVALAAIVGVLFLLLGALRLGFLSEFFSKPVITGFIFGLAMVIAMRQLPKLFGVESGGESFFENLWHLVRNLGETHGWTLFLGLTSLALLFSIEHFFHRIPGALVAMVYGIVVVTVLGLEEQGVHIVGEIPGGIAPPALPDVGLDDIIKLLPGAMGIVILGYAETIGAARRFAAQHRYELDANKELFALGAANLGSGIFQGFAVDASLGKSSANDRAGGRTEMVAIIAAGLTILTAIFLTSLFHNLPEATLAAIVIHAVWGLFDVPELRRYYGLYREEFWLAVTALMGVLVLDVVPGLILAVLLSILLLVYRASRPHFSILGRVPGRRRYGSVERYPENETLPGLIVVRPDAYLFYANATAVRDKVRQLVRAAAPPARAVVLDLEATGTLDITSTDALAQLDDDLRGMDVALWLARVHSQTREMVRRSGLEEQIGADHIYLTVHDAAQAFRQQAASEEDG